MMLLILSAFASSLLFSNSALFIVYCFISFLGELVLLDVQLI